MAATIAMTPAAAQNPFFNPIVDADEDFKEFMARAAIEYYDVETDAGDGERVVVRTAADWSHPDAMTAIHSWIPWNPWIPWYP